MMKHTPINKYNVMTVLNSDYFDFGKLFVNSFYDNIDLSMVNKLYVYDTGLSPIEKIYLESFPNLEVVSTPLKTKHIALHDAEWCKNVYSKTAFLLQVVEKDELPTVMVDSDCIFIRDFFKLLSPDFDFIVCKRNGKGAFSEYIASFFVIHSIEKSSEFIKDWREKMFLGTESHKESPALSEIVYKGKYNIGELAEEVISHTGTDMSESVKIVHMKSTTELRTVGQRIRQPHLQSYAEKYLTECPLIGAENFLSKKAIAQQLNQEMDKDKSDNSLKKLSPQQRALLLQRLKTN